MISCNVIESARKNNVKRVFYSSSACVYPEVRAACAMVVAAVAVVMMAVVVVVFRVLLCVC